MLTAELQKLNTWTAFFEYWIAPRRYEARVTEVAQKCLSILEQNFYPKTDLIQAFEDSSLEGLRGLFKQLPKPLRHTDLFQKLSKALTAISLGLTPKILDAEGNQGFEAFAREGRIEKDLQYYKENLQVVADKISIKFRGVMTAWAEVRTQLPEPIKNRNQPHRAWNYGPEGAQKRNLYCWDTTKPMMPTDICKEKSPWGLRHVFEFCVYYSPEAPRAITDHAWVCLRNSEGRSYEPGLYRPEKIGALDTFKFPFRRKQGFFQERDLSVS